MSAVAHEIAGKRFGRLVAREPLPRTKGQRPWLCVCDCGKEHVTTASALISGRVQSCGCLNQEMLIARNTKHGYALRGRKHPLYIVWAQMIKRCERPGDRSYKYYGARGIRVCARWRNSFSAFLADVGDRPAPGMSLDRKDNDGDYEPGNVRWATKSDQAKNRRPQRSRSNA